MKRYIPKLLMKTYGVNTKVFCDFLFGGKPRGVVVQVEKPGAGNKGNDGLIHVKLIETRGAYKKGEILVLSAFTAVPISQEIPLERGQYFRRVNTLYKFA